MSHQAFRVALTLFVSAVVVARCGNRSPTEPTPSCSPTLSPVTQVTARPRHWIVTLSVAAGCAWTATSSGGWIAVTSGAAGTGPGSVAYTITANCAGRRTGQSISPA